MDSLNSEKFHAKRKRIVLELKKGKNFATQLQSLLQKPVRDDSAEEFVLQIERSFTVALSELSPCAASTESTQIGAAVDCGGSASSGESKNKNKNKKGVKDRRGCYKRRRTSDSWVSVSSTTEDGCAWRKYGQKDIMNSEYPRSYFRCTHKYEGCKATKQVQRLQGDPILYETTYFNHHTCTDQTLITPHLIIVDSDPADQNLISFQADIPLKPDEHSPKPVINNIPPVKQEPKADTAQSSEDPWQETDVRLQDYKPMFRPVMSSSKGSCESITSLHELDMEVNQLGDIDNFQHYFDQIDG